MKVKQFTIEISTRCVAKCYLCTKKPKKNESFETVMQMLMHMKELGMKKVRLTGGEPILADNFYDIIRWLKINNISVEITTTLLTMDEKVLEALLLVDDLRISLSAVRQFYHIYFGISNDYFQMVNNNLQFLLDNGKKLNIQYLLSERTSELEPLFEFITYMNNLADKYGKETIGKVTYIKELGSANPNLDVTKHLRELAYLQIFKSNAAFALTRYEAEAIKPLPSKCLVSRYHMFVKSNGDAYPCCISGGEVNEKLDARLKRGNVLESSKFIHDVEIDSSFEVCKDCFNKYKAINEKIIALDEQINLENF